MANPKTINVTNSVIEALKEAADNHREIAFIEASADTVFGLEYRSEYCQMDERQTGYCGAIYGIPIKKRSDWHGKTFELIEKAPMPPLPFDILPLNERVFYGTRTDCN